MSSSAPVNHHPVLMTASLPFGTNMGHSGTSTTLLSLSVPSTILRIFGGRAISTGRSQISALVNFETVVWV